VEDVLAVVGESVGRVGVQAHGRHRIRYTGCRTECVLYPYKVAR
jgi:hypothetical protein